MTNYNKTMWHDPEYKKRRSEHSSIVQKQRLQNPEYLKEKSEQLKRFTDTLKKPVGMFTKEGELIRTFEGTRAAERWLIEQGITQSKNASSAISDCASGGRHKSAYGYVWKYL